MESVKLQEPVVGPTYAESKAGVMNTRSGVKFNLVNPRAEDVRIEDIASHLSKLCRFTGATSTFYSVAEHSVLVAFEIRQKHQHDRKLQLMGLLHDAAEAYCGDVSKPNKDAMRAVMREKFGTAVTPYDVIEGRVQSAVWERFSLTDCAAPSATQIVKEADNAVYCREAGLWMGRPGVPALSPDTARELFLATFEFLTK